MNDVSETAMAATGHLTVSKGERAKVLARRGFRVFPLHSPVFHENGSVSCSCKSPQCPCTGKHPRIRDFQHGGTTDQRQIETWWAGWPEANVGILTGKEGGMAVIDVDGPEGEDTLRQLERLLGNLPSTLEASTGKGRHLYFTIDGETGLRNSAGALGVGLDVRGEGGYVVGPGSVHENGRIYEWIEEEERLAELPLLWAERLESRGNRDTEAHADTRGFTHDGERIIRGTRNATLTGLAGLYRQQGMSEDLAIDALLEKNRASCIPSLPDAEVKAIVRSVYKLYPMGSWSPSTYPYELNDMGNAHLLAGLFGNHVRYCGAYKSFFLWDGRRFRKDEANEIQQYAMKTVRIIDQIARSVQDETLKTALLKHARKSGSFSSLKGMVSLLQSFPEIALAPNAFNRDLYLLNLLNGTLDLRTGRFKPHDPTDLITKIAPVNYDPAAACSRFEAFIKQIFKDPELSDFVQEVFGTCLTGDVSEQCFFILHGSGTNGKSTILDAVRTVLGEYASHTITETILAKPYATIPNDVARLKDIRFVTTTEVDKGRRIAEGRIKEITGETTITARYLHGEFFEFHPTFKLFLSTNHKPVISDMGHGMWRRVVLLPFEVTIPEAEIDRKLGGKLALETSGILNWLLEGCTRWMKRGKLEKPDCVKKAICDYQDEMDGIAGFLVESCENRTGATIPFKDLYNAYVSWCQSDGTNVPVSKKAFGTRLSSLGYEKNDCLKGSNLAVLNLQMKDPCDHSSPSDSFI